MFAPRPASRWRIVRGDEVIVTAGRDAGKTGKVLRVHRKSNRIQVEGVNMVRKHVKPQGDAPGGVFSVEAPLAYSNVRHVDPETKQGTRVSLAVNDKGEKVRIARSGAVLPKPLEATTKRATRPTEAGPKDTPSAEVLRVTYQPPPWELQE